MTAWVEWVDYYLMFQVTINNGNQVTVFYLPRLELSNARNILKAFNATQINLGATLDAELREFVKSSLKGN